MNFLSETDWDKCKEEVCNEGEGDCDNDEECTGDLKCGVNNCGADQSPKADCCYEPREESKKLFLSLTIVLYSFVFPKLEGWKHFPLEILSYWVRSQEMSMLTENLHIFPNFCEQLFTHNH